MERSIVLKWHQSETFVVLSYEECFIRYTYFWTWYKPLIPTHLQNLSYLSMLRIWLSALHAVFFILFKQGSKSAVFNSDQKMVLRAYFFRNVHRTFIRRSQRHLLPTIKNNRFEAPNISNVDLLFLLVNNNGGCRDRLVQWRKLSHQMWTFMSEMTAICAELELCTIYTGRVIQFF